MQICSLRRNIGKHLRNTRVQQIKVHRQEQRVRETVFRNGGQIISYTMSNTESWAWVNPPTKKLKASSLKHAFNASESGVLSLGLPIKNRWFCAFWDYIFTFCRTCCQSVGVENFYCKCVYNLQLRTCAEYLSLCVRGKFRRLSLLVRG